MGGRVPLQVVAVVRDVSQVVRLNVVEHIGEGHLPVAVMVAVGFPVRGNVDELGPTMGVGESPQEALRQIFTLHKQILKSHRARDRTVVEEKDKGAP